MARNFALVGVIGLGTMGAGIVEVFARNGIDVVAVEAATAGLERGRGSCGTPPTGPWPAASSTEAEQEALHARVRVHLPTSTDLAECDLVVEAVPEHLDLKREIFARLD